MAGMNTQGTAVSGTTSARVVGLAYEVEFGVIAAGANRRG